MARLKVLFICIGNSCRSPMAETMARVIGEGKVAAFSAGLAPAGFVAEPTTATLERLGYPTAGLYSKGLDAIDASEIDVVVSLLGGPGHHLSAAVAHARQEHWSIPDPFGEDHATYLRVARDLEARIRRFLSTELAGELLPD